jgi:hypothetical protein
VRAKRPQRSPVVLNRQEVATVLAALDGVVWIMAMLLNVRVLMESLKDIDFARREILVRER